MNVLLTSSGRRSYLADYFRTAWAGHGVVHAANSSPVSTALYHADRHVITPPIYSREYVDFLVDYCETHDIRAVIPLFDLDLTVLSGNRDRFARRGIHVIVADSQVVNLSNDKWLTLQFAREHGIATPKTWLEGGDLRMAIAAGEVGLPIVVKPRRGMGSIGIHVAETLQELDVFEARVHREIARTYLRHESGTTEGSKVLFQEYLEGTEFGMDVINDLEGRHQVTVVKRKLAMRSGETDAAETVDHPGLTAMGRKIGERLAHPANLDVDVREHHGTPYLLELNARFGGGYPFSHLAGLDLPRAILHWLAGRPAPEETLRWRTGVLGFKSILPETFAGYGSS